MQVEMQRVDKRLENMHQIMLEVLNHSRETSNNVQETRVEVRETGQQVNEKLDVLQDDFDTQRKMLATLKKSLQCRMTRRRIFDWVLTLLCIFMLLYVYFVVHVPH